MKFKVSDVFIFVARTDNFWCGHVQGGKKHHRYYIPVIISGGIPKKDWTYTPSEIGKEFTATDGTVFKLTAGMYWQEIKRGETL